ncbi:translation initiation factor IF-2 [Nitrospira moscoviensis]|uniref:Translation initiation factor IF-2 n=1 Tax=Nitrospira moscoviensis TaxID=42253 RepID=A0A0K2GJQ7_NITMO|nr:translation initiation factor IF-2 [Nitrospira moscoviensis]ALA60857.1 Translation initiation factor IF-2 [Nitrospira moscoviensis]
MRVYELAKKLGMENRDLIPELKKMGVSVASHSSALDEDVVQKVMEKLAPRTKGAGKSADESSHGLRAAGKGAVEEPSKPDKRRILIKRKKEDEPAESAVIVPTGEIEAAAPAPAGLHAPAAPVHQPQAGEPTHMQPAEPLVHREPAPPASVPSAPAVEPAKPLAPAQPSAGVTLEPVTGKKKSMAFEAIEAESQKDKLKKARKPGRPKDEQDVKFREDAARWSDLRAIPVQRRDDRSKHVHHSAPGEITKPRKKSVKVTPRTTVKEFAELIGQRPADIVRKLMEMGQMLTFNQPMNMDAASMIADEVGIKIEIAVEKAGEDLLQDVVDTGGEERPEPRPPVVTIMGHVDHGKTSLLDAIRQTKVAEGEAGGITQHIGAYTVSVHGKQVTFLDTPGHEAFTAMRARGAKVTDIVILVVAADDGVMPQTIEAIHHAKAAGVPLIVAINKIDKPGANPDRVRNALSEHGLISEAWGGDTIMVEVSAKQKTGLDQLLEMILLQSEVLELKADPHRQARGAVVEAKLERGRGPVATVLVQSGTLKAGDVFVVGTFSGRVRALINDRGQKIQQAGPSIPVEVIGLPGVPSAGDVFQVVSDERVAREIAEERARKQRAAELAGPAKVSLDDLFAKIQEGSVKELALVIKADVQGSSEALAGAVEKLPTESVKLRVIHNGVGGITESDVLLAAASRAIIIGFNIRPEPKAAALAEQQGVDIRLYTIIYDAIADIKAAMEGLLEPTLKERTLGRAEVRQVFTIPKAGTVAGSYVLEGTITRASAGVRVIRDNVVVYQGKLASLRRFKDDVREVQQGYECGLSIENFNDVKVGDVIEAYTVDKIAAKL